MAVFASQVARELARDNELDAEAIAGSGRDGAITTQDVREALSSPHPDAPSDLCAAGAALWGLVYLGMPEDWDFDDRESAILTLACHQADDVALCEAVVERDGVEGVGSAGQAVVSPFVMEARQGRQTIARLLGQLAFPDEEDEPQTEASRRAQHAARKRWEAQERKRNRRQEVGDA
jgi:pyruvate/2-oxoglutarate dehydrogenase complex dihydrolipoamide acyltransferase (E2) component